MLKLFQARPSMCAKPWSQRRYDSIFFGSKFRILKLMQQVHRFAVAVPTNDDVPNVIDNAAQLKPSRFTRVVFVLKELTVRHEISSVSYHEHVPDVRVTEQERIKLNFTGFKPCSTLNQIWSFSVYSREPRWDHSWIHASEENCFWSWKSWILINLNQFVLFHKNLLWIISNLLKLPHHLGPCGVPVSHNPSENSFHLALFELI